MSKKSIMGRWVRWNVLHEGIDRSPCGSERYHYTRFALYSYSWPVARLAKGRNKTWVCLAKSNIGLQHELVKETLIVPDLSVFSVYEGDWYDNGHMHERLRWLLNVSAQQTREKAQTWPDRRIMNGGDKILIADLMRIKGIYEEYVRLMPVNWPEFPERYIEELAHAVLARHTRYASPEQTSKRERRWARSEAKEALGINPKKK